MLLLLGWWRRWSFDSEVAVGGKWVGEMFKNFWEQWLLHSHRKHALKQRGCRFKSRAGHFLLSIFSVVKPVLVAQYFKWSRCTANLMYVHTLGASLGAWRKGISGSTMPLYPTRGTGGVIWRKSLPPPISTLIWSSWVQIPWHLKNFVTEFNCSHEGLIFMFMLTFLSYFLHIQLDSCYLHPSFSSSFFLFNI